MMTKDCKPEDTVAPETATDEEVLQSRRQFLVGLGKWSKVVITGAVLGAGVAHVGRDAQAAGWINRRGGYYGPVGGGGWINGAGGGGWVNRRGGVGGGSWINRR
jgi:hypothetical protein